MGNKEAKIILYDILSDSENRFHLKNVCIVRGAIKNMVWVHAHFCTKNKPVFQNT